MPKKRKEYPDWAMTKGRRSRWEEEERKKRIVTRAISAAIVVVIILIAVVVVDAIVDDDNVTVLKVNDRSIKMDDFVQALRFSELTNSTGGEIDPKQVLSEIQQNELLRQLAETRGVSITNEEIDTRIDEIFPSENDSPSSASYDNYLKQLKNRGVSEAFLRGQINLELLAQKMIDTIGAEKVPSEMPQANIRAILIDTTIEEPIIEAVEAVEETGAEEQLDESAIEGTEDQADETEATEVTDADITEEQPVEESVTEGKQDPETIRAAIAARLAAGEDFATLAEAFSQDSTSRLKGGELGWLPDELLSGNLKDVAFEIELGTLSGPIPTSTWSGNTYYWLIEVLEREESRALEEAEQDVLYSQAFDEWFNEETSDQPPLSIKNDILQEAIEKARDLG